MTRFIIFVTLLGVHFASGASEKVVTATEGNYLKLKVAPTGSITKCELETNTGEKFEYEARYSVTINDRIETSDSHCSLYVRANRKMVGHWKITVHATTREKSDETLPPQAFTFKAYIVQTVDVVPASLIRVYEGHYVYAKIDSELEKITACNVTNPAGVTIDMLSTEDEDFQIYGECGFRVLVNRNHSGDWILKAVDDDSVIHSAYVTVRVDSESEKPTEMKTVSLKLGELAKIEVVASVSYCQLEDPTGVMLPLIRDSCLYTIPTVTKYHEGVWTARYAVEGKQDLTVLPFRVVTYEAVTLNTNVTVTETGEIKLLCHVHVSEADKVDFCRFTRPDGVTLNASPGIGTRAYSTFNIRRMRDRRYDLYCGLVIHEPLDRDFGSWTCGISGKYVEKYRGSWLRLDRSVLDQKYSESARKVSVKGENVHVKQGDGFKIKCLADAPLSYCWFRSPNGTDYSVSYNKKIESANSLRYEGAGLRLGECVAKIDRADYEHRGQWTCNLGIVDAGEERQTVSVEVTESYLVAEREGLTIDGSNLTLSCHILPSVTDRSVHYCRWIRPDGYGIHNSVNHRYATASSKSRCELSILNYATEDIGKWTCIAGLMGTEMTEALANVSVQTPPLHFGMLIGVAIAATVLLAITASIFILIKTRDRQRTGLPKEPPAYSAEPPEKTVNVVYVSKEFQY